MGEERDRRWYDQRDQRDDSRRQVGETQIEEVKRHNRDVQETDKKEIDRHKNQNERAQMDADDGQGATLKDAAEDIQIITEDSRAEADKARQSEAVDTSPEAEKQETGAEKNHQDVHE